ncbi:lysylphosphatidylglycerol synthase transmembrane domain-containing protein [Spirillospora sp. CA-255316]
MTAVSDGLGALLPASRTHSAPTALAGRVVPVVPAGQVAVAGGIAGFSHGEAGMTGRHEGMNVDLHPGAPPAVSIRGGGMGAGNEDTGGDPPPHRRAGRGRAAYGPWLRTLAGAAIIGALIWWHSTDAFVAALGTITTGSVVAALGIGLLTTVVSALRWRLVARRLGLRLRCGAAVADYYRALFLNAVLPAGVLGDVHRAVSHGRDAGDVGRAVRAVVLERLAGLIVVIVAGSAVLLAQPAPLAAMAPGLVPVAVVAAGVLAVAAVVVLARGRLGRALSAATADARRVLLGRDTWPGIVLLSAAGFAGHITLFLVAARVAGADAPLTRLLPLVVLALLAMGLPVNVGGWGPREAATALAFGAAGLGAGQGLAVAVVYGALTLVSSLPGAAVLIFRAVPRAVPALAVEDAEVVPERLDERPEKVPALTGGGQ